MSPRECVLILPVLSILNKNVWSDQRTELFGFFSLKYWL